MGRGGQGRGGGRRLDHSALCFVLHQRDSPGILVRGRTCAHAAHCSFKGGGGAYLISTRGSKRGTFDRIVSRMRLTCQGKVPGEGYNTTRQHNATSNDLQAGDRKSAYA